MALNKEIWQSSIIDNLFPDDSFAAKSVDDSAFVDNKTVHIPNAGAPSGVQTNRTEKPASVKTRTDNDLSYNMDELTTDPIYIPNIDTVQLSYNKRESVISNDRRALQHAAHLNLLNRWGKGAEDNVVMTTGTAVAAHTSDVATGQRKALAPKDVFDLMAKFDAADIPQNDRYILLDAYMYAHFLDAMSNADKRNFFASANAQKGVLGELAGFQFLKRSRVLRLNADKKVADWSAAGAATELAAGFAWQKECVSRALGGFKMFSDIDSPTYYGDIYSFLIMTGGACRRYDKEGVALIAEAAV